MIQIVTFVHVTALSSDKYFSFFPKWRCSGVNQIFALEKSCSPACRQTDNHSESTGLESSGLPVGIKTGLGEGIKKNTKLKTQTLPKPSLPLPRKTPTSPKPQTRAAHEAQAERGPCWQDDETHVHQLQTHCPPAPTNRFFRLWTPQTRHSYLALTLAPASRSQRQHHTHCTRAAACWGKGGIPVSKSLFIKDKNSQHTWIIILLKQGWLTIPAAPSVADEQEDGTHLGSHMALVIFSVTWQASDISNT